MVNNQTSQYELLNNKLCVPFKHFSIHQSNITIFSIRCSKSVWAITEVHNLGTFRFCKRCLEPWYLWLETETSLCFFPICFAMDEMEDEKTVPKNVLTLIYFTLQCTAYRNMLSIGKHHHWLWLFCTALYITKLDITAPYSHEKFMRQSWDSHETVMRQ